MLHRAAYAELGLDWTYEAIDCGIDDLPGVLASRKDWAGFSCTMPLKRAAMDAAATVTPRAAAIGSANTLLPGAGGWIADNTDVTGVVAALRSRNVAPTTATVLGAGGTAQAVLAALLDLGLVGCTVLVRNAARATTLQHTAARLGVAVTLGTLEASSAALQADLVVSTLPGSAADPLAARPWLPEQVVLDVVYEPWPTPLATAAASSGATVVSGASMLLYQALAQVELMTGRRASVESMRAALRAVRPSCGV